MCYIGCIDYGSSPDDSSINKLNKLDCFAYSYSCLECFNRGEKCFFYLNLVTHNNTNREHHRKLVLVLEFCTKLCIGWAI